MAKQSSDLYTLDMLDKPQRGRPRKPDALTPAERARNYRARKTASRKIADRLRAHGVVALYRGPNGETWSGRGLMPRWLHVLVREGVDKNLYLVKV